MMQKVYLTLFFFHSTDRDVGLTARTGNKSAHVANGLQRNASSKPDVDHHNDRGGPMFRI